MEEGFYSLTNASQGPRKLMSNPLPLCKGHPSCFPRDLSRAPWLSNLPEPSPGLWISHRDGQGTKGSSAGQLPAQPSAFPQPGIGHPAGTKDLAALLTLSEHTHSSMPKPATEANEFDKYFIDLFSCNICYKEEIKPSNSACTVQHTHSPS